MSSRQGYHFKQSPFFRLRSKSKLAKILHLSPQKLRELSKETHSFYLSREIYNLEKNKIRQIEKPERVMRTVHNRLRDMLGKMEVPDYIFSPGTGKSTIQNALLHQDSSCLFKIDIKKYFPSITKQKIYDFFYFKMECSKDVSAILAEISTFFGHLPTGSPLSPIMSYHVNSDMWEKIYLRTLKSNCRLSVWVDDICISGGAIPRSLVWDIKKIVHNHGFKYHKEFIYRSSESKSVTGIIVTPSKIMPRKGQYKKLRDLYRAKSSVENELASGLITLQIEGLKKYIDNIEASN